MRAFESEKTDVAEVDRSIYDIRDGSNALCGELRPDQRDRGKNL